MTDAVVDASDDGVKYILKSNLDPSKILNQYNAVRAPPAAVPSRLPKSNHRPPPVPEEFEVESILSLTSPLSVTTSGTSENLLLDVELIEIDSSSDDEPQLNQNTVQPKFQNNLPKSQGTSTSTNQEGPESESDSEFGCIKCLRIFGSENLLKKHQEGSFHICRRVKDIIASQRANTNSLPTRWGKREGPLNGNTFLALPTFNCLKCSVTFSEKSSLETHLATHSQPQQSSALLFTVTFNCRVASCSRKFLSPHLLNEHEKIHGKETNTNLLWECTICSAFLRSKCGLKMHLTNIHHRNPENVPSRNRKRGSKRRLGSKLSDPVYSDSLNEYFDDSDGAHNQFNNILDSDSDCKIFSTTEQDPLQQTPPKWVTKTEANSAVALTNKTETDTDKFTLAIASVEANREKYHKCPICSLSLFGELKFQRHRRKQEFDSGGAPLKCSKCPQLCCSKFQLQMHMNKDHGKNQKPFPCPAVYNCPKSFASARSLNSHITFAHKSQNLKELRQLQHYQYKCSQPGCEEAFSSLALVEEHCVSCRRNNKSESEFQNISETEYSQPRKFSCPHKTCDRKFFSHQDKLRHARICLLYPQHPNNPKKHSYECDVCEKFFKYELGLQVHNEEFHQAPEHEEEINDPLQPQFQVQQFLTEVKTEQFLEEVNMGAMKSEEIQIKLDPDLFL